MKNENTHATPMALNVRRTMRVVSELPRMDGCPDQLAIFSRLMSTSTRSLEWKR
jgi:hypothetical protein